MAATKRASSSTTIPHSAIEDATMALQELPEKPRTEWPLRDAVEKMRDPLLAAMAKGYTYEDLAQMLAQRGVAITSASLKYYMTRGRKAKDGSQRSKPRSHGHKLKEGAVPEVEPTETSAIPVEGSEPISRNGSGRPSSQPLNQLDEASLSVPPPPSASRSSRSRSTSQTAAKTASSSATQTQATRPAKAKPATSTRKRKSAES